MNLDELKEQLQENICTYLDGFNEDIIDDLCQIVVDTFNQAFFAPAP